MQCIDSFSEYQHPNDENVSSILTLTGQEEEDDIASPNDENDLKDRNKKCANEQSVSYDEVEHEQLGSVEQNAELINPAYDGDDPEEDCTVRAFSALPVVPAVLVRSDEEDRSQHDHEQSLRKVKGAPDSTSHSNYLLILTMTGSLLLVIVLALSLGFGLKSGTSISQSNTPAPSSTTVPVRSPTDEIKTIPPSVAFQTTQELYDAVDRWLAGENSADTNLAATYGYPIGQWDVSRITNFSQLFYACKYCSRPPGRSPLANVFNDDISMWNVSNARNMSYMFRSAAAFNGNLSTWDVSHVTDMKRMFRYATSFNGDISMWDVSQVRDMESMFYYSSAFNCNIAQWNVSNVQSMTNMFYVAAVFNQDLCNWGRYLPAWAHTTHAFRYAACPFENDPMLNTTPPGPFCHFC